MGQDLEALYQARLRRYVTALNNGKPDRVPIRPFAAEFTGRHAGYTCQQLTQHYPDAFEAMIRCCKAYDWDAVPASMVYVWTGITDAAGVKYPQGEWTWDDYLKTVKALTQAGALVGRAMRAQLVGSPFAPLVVISSKRVPVWPL